MGPNEDRFPRSSAHQPREPAQGGEVEGSEAGHRLVRLPSSPSRLFLETTLEAETNANPSCAQLRLLRWVSAVLEEEGAQIRFEEVAERRFGSSSFLPFFPLFKRNWRFFLLLPQSWKKVRDGTDGKAEGGEDEEEQQEEQPVVGKKRKGAFFPLLYPFLCPPLTVLPFAAPAPPKAKPARKKSTTASRKRANQEARDARAAARGGAYSTDDEEFDEPATKKQKKRAPAKGKGKQKAVEEEDEEGAEEGEKRKQPARKKKTAKRVVPPSTTEEDE